RHGATSLLAYRDQGYLPEAMMNFLALLGWSLDDKTEIISRDDLIANFSIERIGSSGAIFNVEKLRWMNGVYLRQLAQDDLARRMTPFLERGLPDGIPRPIPQDYLASIVPLIQDRIKTLDQSVELTGFFFVDELNHDPALLVQKKMERSGALAALETALQRLEALETFDAGTLEGLLRPLAEELGLKAGQLFGTLRVAVTGQSVAPPLFETMAVLGRERCLGRIREAVQRLRRSS
ncbi:MAG: glutamate--tRNA ligase family protein, partial [Dehalococcoidia bacterium]